MYDQTPYPEHTGWPIQQLIAGLMLIALTPVLVVLWIAVRIDSRGPFIFKQKRPGFGEVEFNAFKIRTMSQGAERSTALGVTSSDPRITRVGSVLRATKLDEIPQLYNIARGEMCFVGPRPIPVALDRELRAQIPGFAARYRVPPGITSLAQICVSDNGLGERLVRDWRERFEAEMRYARLRCVWYDLTVLTMTGCYVIKKIAHGVGRTPNLKGQA